MIYIMIPKIIIFKNNLKSKLNDFKVNSFGKEEIHCFY